MKEVNTFGIVFIPDVLDTAKGRGETVFNTQK